jgi:hypothetical protein
MCSITQPRRVTVSCKHIFSSYTNERSTATSSFRNAKRRLNDNIIPNAKVFHIPFTVETKFFSNNDKLLRTSLNLLSPIFYSNLYGELISR